MKTCDDATGTIGLTGTNLAFGYEKDQPIIQDFDAVIKSGKVSALIGPNAAGKSTLLKLLLGQLQPWQGKVLIDGTNLDNLSVRQRAQVISYVPQRGVVSFAFTVEQVVSMGRYALQHDDQAVDRAIEVCDLAKHRGRVYSQLSAGQQQRVLLARAIAQCSGGGKVMLLDEPGSAMDLWHQHRTMATLKALANHGLAILVVLHDLNLAARYADDVLLIDQGQLVAGGSWNDVLTCQVLEPVYRVKLHRMLPDNHTRPVFLVEPSDTILTSDAL